MKKITLLIVFVLMQIPLIANSAEIEDEFMRGIFKYLAKNRNMNLVAYSGEKVAEIGKLYYVEEPDNAKTLTKWSKKGNPLKLFLYDNRYTLDENKEYQKEEDYLIGEKYSDYLGAELQATLKSKGIDIRAFKSALRKAKIRFSVVRKIVPASIVSESLQQDKEELINEFEKFGQGAGIVMPFQQLLVTNFRYNETSSEELKALLSAEILETVKAKMSASLIKTQDVSVGLPASATIAIKPFPVYFKETNFWGRWF